MISYTSTLQFPVTFVVDNKSSLFKFTNSVHTPRQIMSCLKQALLVFKSFLNFHAFCLLHQKHFFSTSASEFALKSVFFKGFESYENFGAEILRSLFVNCTNRLVLVQM